VTRNMYEMMAIAILEAMRGGVIYLSKIGRRQNLVLIRARDGLHHNSDMEYPGEVDQIRGRTLSVPHSRHLDNLERIRDYDHNCPPLSPPQVADSDHSLAIVFLRRLQINPVLHNGLMQETDKVLVQ
jgi:hypothetical protein